MSFSPPPRTRFAPSPTGYLHIGGVRTALFSWLHARRHGGVFVLRIEDTDRERSTEASVNVILEGMRWLDLGWDEGPYFQTRRFDRYREILERLLEEGKAYRCYCSRERLETLRAGQMARKEKPRYDGLCRDRRDPPPEGAAHVVRFRNPADGVVMVDDLIRGRVAFQNRELDDLIIARADGTPTYNFTVVVDDHDMGITHVIRGDDHLNNTPRQINILRALEAQPPVYAHVPMILGPDGKRLSKRHGAVSVLQYRDEGYLPEALLNYLVRLGWSHGDQEVFSREEMIRLFDIREVNKAASIFNPDKLLWLNQHYLKTLEPAVVARHLAWHLQRLDLDPAAGPPLEEVVLAQRERAKTLQEMARNSAFLFREPEGYDEKAADKHLGEAQRPILTALRAALAELDPWTPEAVHATVGGVAEAAGLKLGKVAQPLRVALTGGTVSPPIDVTVYLLGRDRTLARIARALGAGPGAGRSGVTH
ncbi:glutamate--tRNA ligase [bacterium BMS3Bbin12]|nr:glutamate--tRNA ligase [bacterium BMS3Bbin12]GBE50666.1 glutamate--tRNA ligase [bacterium BMS3Bbin13]HDO34421.1 glutamate--tRNA ligase [Chromatiales bacterium]